MSVGGGFYENFFIFPLLLYSTLISHDLRRWRDATCKGNCKIRRTMPSPAPNLGRVAYEFNCSTLRLRRPYQFFPGFTFDIIILNILFFSFSVRFFLSSLSTPLSLSLWEAAQEASAEISPVFSYAFMACCFFRLRKWNFLTALRNLPPHRLAMSLLMISDQLTLLYLHLSFSLPPSLGH